MTTTHPRKIPGRWREGFTLDFHTLSSAFVGHDEYGHPQFDTKRSEIGELLYRLKNRSDTSVIDGIVDAAASFVRSWNPGIDSIVPVPPSKPRIMQPLLLIGEKLSEGLDVSFVVDGVTKVRDTPQLKDIYDYHERMRLLNGAHEVDRAKVAGRKILLLDDLYRSGATMNVVAEALYEQGGASEVFALAITRTRSLQ